MNFVLETGLALMVSIAFIIMYFFITKLEVILAPKLPITEEDEGKIT
jgi:hypothetical protein